MRRVVCGSLWHMHIARAAPGSGITRGDGLCMWVQPAASVRTRGRVMHGSPLEHCRACVVWYARARDQTGRRRVRMRAFGRYLGTECGRVHAHLVSARSKPSPPRTLRTADGKSRRHDALLVNANLFSSCPSKSLSRRPLVTALRAMVVMQRRGHPTTSCDPYNSI